MREKETNTIYGLLRTRAEQNGEAIAIVAPGRRPLTYRQLLFQVDQTLESFKSNGITCRDRIAVVLPAGPDLATAFLAISSLATSIPLNPAYRENEFDFYLSAINPKAVIVQSGMSGSAVAVAEKYGISTIELLPEPEASAGIFTLRNNERSRNSSDVAFPDANDIALILHTSGTTSRPKIVPLTHANLLASADNIAATLGLCELDRCLNVMPLFHIHGLVGGLLSSVMSGASVICTSGFDVEQFFPWLDAFRPTWYTAVPTIHHAVLARAQAIPKLVRKHSLRFVRSSSSALPAPVMQGLEELFEVPVIESYGMTEAAHQMASNPLPPAQRKIGSVGLAAGPKVSIMDETGQLLSPGKIGEIVIRGANVMHGYENNSEANALAFTRGWFRTGDQGHLDKDGYLFITGRLKELINRGGEKIAPREVEEVILRHPAVAEAITFAMPHETLGEDVAAAVVLRNNSAVTEGELQSFVAAHLTEFKIPKRILFVDKIPTSATGKPQRVGMAEKFGALLSEQAIHEFVPPQTQVEKTLSAIWSKVLRVEHIGIHDNFFNLGGDSIRATQVISRVRESMQTELSILSFFANPRLADLADYIERTRRTKPPLEASPIQPVSRNEKLPLSFAQQRLWFLSQLEPASIVYHRSLALRITGKLQTQAIEQCLNEIVRRHEVLRTNFQVIDGEPVQVIAPNRNVDLPLIDLSKLPYGERESEALRQAIRESQKPFDLARGALLRTCLYRLGGQNHLLLFVTHHMVFDGWSDNVLLGELAILYEAFSKGNPSLLTDLPIQYADFGVWQRNWLQGEVLEGQLAYWRKQLQDIPSVINLPTDRPWPAVQSYRGASQSIEISKELTLALKALSGSHAVTLYMTLLAAFQTLLHRYTGQDNIVVGSPIANRNLQETESLIGFFVNTLVMRSDLSGDPTFRELLRRVREVALGAYAHQDLPFEKLVEELQPKRSFSHSPLFQVMFVLQNAPASLIEFAGLTLRPFTAETETTKFELTLTMSDEAEGLRGSLQYKTDLFNEVTIKKMLGHFQTLVEGIVADPDQHISELPILTAAEKHQLLVEWNDTTRGYPTDQRIHQLFEAHAERTPDVVAVVFEAHRLTYRELNAAANRLALLLADRGVGPGSYVPFLMDRSIEVVIAMLAIMKSGAAFVPLHIEWPDARIKQILDDLKSDFILVNQKTPYGEKALGCSFLTVSGRTDIPSPAANPNINVDARESIYVIYTSGSTGKPKGAVVPHRGITNRFLWMNEFFGSPTAAAALQTTHHVYDSAVWQLFWPLINGGKTVIPSPGRETDAGYLAGLIHKNEVTITDFVPSVFNTIVPQLVDDQLVREKLKFLRTIIVGGEEITPSTTYTFMAQFPDVRVVNLYGPTEASIGCICYEVNGKEGGRIPIGRPISNVHALVLDKNKKLVPGGFPGELYISGICLGLGYLNDEEKSRALFIDNPFPEIGYAKLYKTGDLARYLPDGNIEFLGRIDNQVKIRGFRIELGEIETVLAHHPSIQQAVVLAREDTPGDKRLVAYVVTTNGSTISTHDLRSFLQHKLPDYMVPSAFVFLESLPLTPNGKIDRKALPAPDHSRPELDDTFAAPRTPVEEILANIWAVVLNLDGVGIHDNFFHLGGHSLLATQVVSRVNTVFQIDFPLRRLFETPTIAEMAAVITAYQGTMLAESQLATILDELASLSDAEAQGIVSEINSTTTKK